MRRVLSLILGGGRGTRLAPLTSVRSKPAVPIGGKYRLIDIPISNCLNSNIRRIYVLTQFNSESLHRHINSTYKFDPFSQGFLEVLAASQTFENAHWYQGTADAVRHNMHHFEKWEFTEYLILAGDHLYRMNYDKFVYHHRSSAADITISVKAVSREEAKDFGVLKVDSNGRIVRFAEKPKEDKILDEMTSDTGNPDKPYWGSMGIYVFSKKILRKALSDIQKDDFGGDIIPGAIESGYHVQAFFFNGYWEDIGTIRSFYDANIAMTSQTPPFCFRDPLMPIYTHARMLPGSHIGDSCIVSSTVGEGSMIRATSIRKSVIGIRSIINYGTTIESSYIMGNDYFEEDRETSIPLGIGRNCVIKNAIIDKNVHIGNDVQILNKNGIDYKEESQYWIRDGIVVVKKGAVLEDGTII
ncbi:MAG: glucose-1-phosphate adenylyltransferase [Candidatus Neomarinimicrobiota bacterium]|nr:glucose-1-phosphate adenylyltransferase [Candidatus Neomarinimicrobiota bacterium]RKY48311.1 MAG: glucose-1-phosphate adenylyltransferase [Candidatus Neomarinimicrobiota bacterium]